MIIPFWKNWEAAQDLNYGEIHQVIEAARSAGEVELRRIRRNKAQKPIHPADIEAAMWKSAVASSNGKTAGRVSRLKLTRANLGSTPRATT